MWKLLLSIWVVSTYARLENDPTEAQRRLGGRASVNQNQASIPSGSSASANAVGSSSSQPEEAASHLPPHSPSIKHGTPSTPRPPLSLAATPSNLWRFLRNSAAKVGDVAAKTVKTQQQLQQILQDLTNAQSEMAAEHQTLSSRNLSLKARLSSLKQLYDSLNIAKTNYQKTGAEVERVKGLVRAKEVELEKTIADGGIVVDQVKAEAQAARDRAGRYEKWMNDMGVANSAAPVVPAVTPVAPPAAVPVPVVPAPQQVTPVVAPTASVTPVAAVPVAPVSPAVSFASLVRAAKVRGEKILKRERVAERNLQEVSRELSVEQQEGCKALTDVTVMLKKVMEQGKCGVV